MKRFGVIEAAGLVLWGFCAKQPWLGALLAAGLLAPGLARLRLPVNEVHLRRLAKASLAAALAILAGFLVLQGSPQGLMNGAGWLPLALFPLALATRLSDAPLRFALPRSGGNAGARVAPPVDFARFYLAVTLLASSVITPNADWYYPALAGVVLLWLFLMRSGATPGSGFRAGTGAFALAALLASGGGLLLGGGLERSHQAVDEWAMDFLSDSETDPNQSQTSIGKLGKVELSGRIVWRVRLQPANVPLLLRSGVFTYFSGQTWSARQDAFTPLTPAPATGQTILQLRGQSSKGVALLPLPPATAQIQGAQGRLERNPYGVVRLRDAPAEIEFTASPGGPPEMPPQTADLALPPRYRQLLSRIPQLVALASASEHQRLAGLQDWFSANFRYTLFLGSGKDASKGRDLEQFLLEDRAGHCEYFASATVLLLRGLGIPARYVTGYSVQEYSTLEDAFLVRQRHAHAWAEAYVDGRWVEVDTTPATWLTEEEQRMPFWQPVSDLLSYLWQRIGEWRQAIVIGDLRRPAFGLGAAILAVLAGFLLRRLRRAGTNAKAGNAAQNQGAKTPERIALDQLEAEFAARGLPPRHATEPPQRWIARIKHEGATRLNEAELARAQAVITATYRRCYGP